MSNFTPNQLQAIEIKKGNALVSAGAGSGKTKVLTERVRRLVVEDGVPLESLVVLTFTKAAAHEMKERIRKELAKNPATRHLGSEVDASDITTFDAYALSLVKKYHGYLGLPKEVNNLDEQLMEIEKKRIIEAIFDEYYQTKPAVFIELIQRFVLRDDENLKNFILEIDKKSDLKLDKKAYFSDYLAHHFADDFLENALKEANQLMVANIEEIKLLSYDIQHEKELNNINALIESLVMSDDFDITRQAVLHATIKRKVNGLDEQDSFIHQAIKERLEESQMYAELGERKTIIAQYMATRPIVELLLEILAKLNERTAAFKAKHQSYLFADIAKMALSLLDIPEVQTQLKAKIQYIMIDEYQDTSDLQEAFLQKIANQNLYMVGDIKQSIYRFRNANSAIFADKFSLYGQNIGGKRVDLNHNFRSREEVLQDINAMFSQMMTLDFGGANYRQDHIIQFGNKKYATDLKTTDSHHTSIYTYDKEVDVRKDFEIEADMIAQDIRRKIDSGYQIVDRETFVLRNATYKDFTVLMDRKTHFEDFRNVFERYAIPLDVEKEEQFLSTDVALTFLSLIRLLHHLHQKDDERYIQNYFMSVARSFLFEIPDQDIFTMLTQNTYRNHPIMQTIDRIERNVSVYSLSMIITDLLESYNFYHQLIRLGNVQSNLAKIQHMVTLSQTLENLQYELADFIRFFDDIKDAKTEIKMKDNDGPENAVRIMSIHGSKGLEFPVVYYAGLAVPFNQPDQKKKFFIDGRLGIHLPNDSSTGRTLFHHLMMANENHQDISEKVRLFYVALTRACEKMIIIRKKRKDALIPSLRHCQCLDDFLTFVDGIERYNEDFVPYVGRPLETEPQAKTRLSLVIEDLNIKPIPQVAKIKAAKEVDDTVDPQLLTLGSELHYLLELVNFKSKDTTFIDDPKMRRMVDRVISLSILGDIDRGEVFKEYPWFDEDTKTTGIIDGFILYQDRIVLFDYKLSNIDDIAYDEQVQKYASYLSKAFHLPIRAYLISLFKGEYREVSLARE